MSNANNLDLGPLTWVKPEIDLALTRADEAIGLATGPDGAARLQFAQTHLHQARGALSIVGLDGLTQFASALDQLLGLLARGEREADASALALARRALATIGNYLEELVHGTPDQPLRLSALYGDLVARSGGEPASPAELFYPDLSLRPPRRKPAVRASEDELAQQLRAQRATFQRGLLQWLRSAADPAGPGTMREALLALDSTHAGTPSGALWWAGQAFVEALASGDLPARPDIRRLCSQLELQMRRMSEAAQPVPEKLMRELLYWISQAPARTEHQQAVRASWQLDALLPEPGSTVSETPLAPLLKSIHGVLGTAKLEWDEFCTGHAAALPRFDAQLAELTRRASQLGRPALDRLLAGIVEFTAWLRKDPLRFNEGIALEVATAMLLAEAALDRVVPDAGFSAQATDTVGRLGALARGEAVPAAEGSPTLETARRAQEREALAQLSREIRSSLAQVEQILDDYFRNQDKRGPLAGLSKPLRQIEGALTLVGDAQAIALVHEAGETVARFAAAETAPERSEFEVLAQRLSALGFYVDALQHGRADLTQFLEPQGRTRAQDDEPEALPARESAAPAPDLAGADAPRPETTPQVEIVESSPPRETVPTSEEWTWNEALEDEVDHAESLPAAELPGAAAPAAAAPAATGDLAEPALDAELLEIFIEEAHEVLATIAEQLDRLVGNGDHDEALVSIRRGFHTLKGSGRMVGLRDLGEAAWGIEQTLNRWLQLEWPPSPELTELIDTSSRVFGQWVERLEQGDGRAIDVSALMADAERLRSGDAEPAPARPADATQTPTDVPAAAPVEVPVEPWEPDLVETSLEFTPIEDAAEPDASIGEPAFMPEETSLDDLIPFDAQIPESPEGIGPEAAVEPLAPQHETEAADLAQPAQEAEEPVEPPAAPEPPEPLELSEPLEISEPLAFSAPPEPSESLEPSASLEAPEPAEPAGAPETFEIFDLDDRPGAPELPTLPEASPAGADEASASITEIETSEFVLPADFDFPDLPDLAPQTYGAETAPAVAPPRDTADDADGIEVEASVFDFGDLDDARLAPHATPVDEAHAAEPGATADDTVELSEAATDQAEPVAADTVESGDLTAPVDSTEASERDDLAAAADFVRVGDTEVTRPLYELFLGEARHHLSVLRTELERLRANPTLQPPEPAVRAAHTLAGIAGTTRIASLQELARAFEYAIERLRELDRAPTREQTDLLGATSDTMEAMLAEIANGTMPLAVPELTEQLEAVGRERDLEAVPEAVDDELLAERDYTEADAAEVPPAPVHDDLDPQLLPIFLEEAAELIRELHAALRSWQAGESDEPVRATARLLHTLKGSARMTGAMTLGEHVHQLESRLDAALKAGQDPSGLIEELVAGLDLIEQAVESMPAAQAPAVGSKAQSEELSALAATLETVAPETESAAGATLRVRSDTIDRFVNEAGEIGIARTRIAGELRTLRRSLLDLTENVIRLRNQLREVEIQADVQMQSRIAQAGTHEGEFDPLEMDRYTRLQELTRMMAESVGDVTTVQQSLLRNLDGAELALNGQARMSRDLQQALMQVRMVPFDSLADRLYRVVRQTAKDLGKRANLDLRGGRIEIDRSVLTHMTAPLEHLLRNAVAHGIESAEARRAAGKDEIGQLTLGVSQEGNEIAIVLSDDGGGLDYARIAERARANGLLGPDEVADERRLTNLIFIPGFSTAGNLSTVSGRGVGMDVVKSETAAVGGRIDIHAAPGRGTEFRIYLPLTLAVTQALLVRAAGRSYAVPSSMIAQVLELKADALAQLRADGGTEWQGERFAYRYLPQLLGDHVSRPELQRFNWVLLLRAGAQTLALHVDALRGNQEIVVKNAGPQLARIVGVSGATVLGDGEIVLILNPVALASRSLAQDGPDTEAAPIQPPEAAAVEDRPPTILVVDDSLTVRKITGRLLEREGYRVVTAKDGVDALEHLLESVPDVILSDIEMPRMDGFDLLRNIRADERTRAVPVIMITSRLADKHREYAQKLGADHYLGKPYEEDELLGLLRAHTAGLRLPA